ncbi:hypothetical protein DUNSADRAFT_8804 [Dunaliella salina]|uniref:Encoded protein n=1 Tax=Dunaliella salina TaxID=3046 RepID=A0ABQ7GIS1_DUNSA|nr:hypothetical protein DUNSADRAFT_8804 [Dunaliella salina]|eukprot:KAF5834511.1 hypothetical protein DUNSADRAFT_8804 [Dunaliella salina]
MRQHIVHLLWTASRLCRQERTLLRRVSIDVHRVASSRGHSWLQLPEPSIAPQTTARVVAGGAAVVAVAAATPPQAAILATPVRMLNLAAAAAVVMHEIVVAAVAAVTCELQQQLKRLGPHWQTVKPRAAAQTVRVAQSAQSYVAWGRLRLACGTLKVAFLMAQAASCCSVAAAAAAAAAVLRCLFGAGDGAAAAAAAAQSCSCHCQCLDVGAAAVAAAAQHMGRAFGALSRMLT